MLDVNRFDQIKIGLATSDEIRSWSHGEVKKPETINYRTLKPEKDGLFGEQIFGPTRDWECACGKYKRPRFKGIVCERCGVEVTRSKVRRERMGHIELAAPVTHIWYFKGVPSRLGYLLDIAPKDLEKVIYFAAYMVTEVDEEGRREDMPSLLAEYELERQAVEKQRDADLEARHQELEQELATAEAEGQGGPERARIKRAGESDLNKIRRKADRDLERLAAMWDRFTKLTVGDLEGDEDLYREMESRYGDYFKAARGAEAIQARLRTFDLEAEHDKLVEEIETGTAQKKSRALKRIKVVNAFLRSGTKPEAMVLDAIPVIPPDLRPMVQLDGGRFATSDLNDLYRRVINRNNRLKRMLDLHAPEIMVNNEKRMLQESVDALFDNGRRGRPVQGAGNRPLKSLADMLKGKQGRFRQNLLGKRVDYSGRSVIVVGPTLKLHQCGLPTAMALELFKPFVQKRLVDLDIAKNIKAAKRLVERQDPQVWDVLEEVIQDHPVLLNRAPTLHRLGIQAFEPKLVEGKAIRLHPLVCGAFNADFDGDQMAVHLPLSVEAQAEARILMLSSNNILKPSDGRPVTMPSQDMIIGVYGLTKVKEGKAGEGHAFTSTGEARMAYDLGKLDLNSLCKIRFEGDVEPPLDWEAPEGHEPGEPFILETTLGRTIFNNALPTTFPFVNEVVDKSALGRIVNHLAERYEKDDVAASLDAIKNTGFYWAGRSGVTIAVSDVVVPDEKPAIIAEAEKKAAVIENQFLTGRIEDEDRRRDLVDLWSDVTDEIAHVMRDNFTPENTVNQMVVSGARGNWEQMRQIAGMRGLVADPKGAIIPRPIISSYREGLSVLEYFSATHGARKGLADTALRTADSGYLTRRLVDVSQDVIVNEFDCQTKRGLAKEIAQLVPAGKPVPAGALGSTVYVRLAEPRGEQRFAPQVLEAPESGELLAPADLLIPERTLDTSVYARTLLADITDEEGTVLAQAGADIGDELIERLLRAGVTQVRIRSVLTCQAKHGTCALCYGRSMATGKLVDLGEAVGIVAAQSIGEPGTQLTMRTFHTGGSASADDITQGLPRVQELFEARTPKGEAPIAEAAGTLRIEDGERMRRLIVVRDDGEEDLVYQVSKRAKLYVPEGGRVQVGQQLVEGSVDPKKLLRISGRRAVQEHIVNEVQAVYRSQGVDIHDKHIEIIVRQMLRRVTVLDSGTTNLLPGELVEVPRFEEENRAAMAEGGKPAAGRPELMGITKASLATDSWLSAASFQETTRVLTEAALEGKSDPLAGLKENVILGKLIPAGTGFEALKSAKVEPTTEAKMEFEKNNGFAAQGLDPFDDSFSYGDFQYFDLGAGYGAF
ncbi:DNA-directed RNA polymerase subunit beta' [Actinobaculum suis]|uniref:DNA-directed RNA polymerase subunit beta' n=1 Tax=Actinobaculum suis TaxID=1657 RepID=A0A0K9EVJ9_9ACTO|nr:DNA-directed RNA polymerase subunit beta' [Actinobaculum suis]KMY24153.1 DNA-directed RNA polymerase subunit beta' [Actinobaculum suis]MDY5153481.1 DNA-directed RNA polymerase subunit beta' [Actinobaculum suis]OCA93446.1 DNA-directed RNA polymerase subunit beta' [Actinobaculum suis]OCA95268.1 DNA-directed RNA polymerase subunit beta' [Actinobaculum suis]SDE19388.1 DNA-directed RNA polymerase subunit beta' [Actinobaculum suis]